MCGMRWRGRGDATDPAMDRAGHQTPLSRERSLPFDPFDKAGPTPPPPHAPNEETVAAIQAAERGELTRIGHPSNVIADLDAD